MSLINISQSVHFIKLNLTFHHFRLNSIFTHYLILKKNIMKKITLLAAIFAVFTMNAQIFSEDFEGEIADTNDFAQFTAIDVDGDGENWEITDLTGTDQEMSPLAGLAADSDSWEQAPFSPDQYLITNDLLNLNGATGDMTFTMGTYQTNGTFIGDRLAIYLSTSNDPGVISGETPVFDMTVADVTPATDGATSGADVTVDISAFIGQQVYLVFRHFDTTDENSVLIDNIVVEGSLGTDSEAFESFSYFVDANNRLNLNANTTLENVTLTNVLGQQVISQKLTTSSEVVDMSSLTRGMYIATVTMDGAKKSFKVIKK